MNTLSLGTPNLFQIVINGVTYQLSVTINQTDTGLSITTDSTVTSDSSEPSDD